MSETSVNPSMPLIDIGVNLSHDSFERDRDAVLERACLAGVRQMVLTGTCIEQSRHVLELCQQYAGQPLQLVCTAGIHPHSAREWNLEAASQLGRLAAHDEVRAIGECGLDFNRDFSPRPQQEKALEAQLELACRLGKPVFLHERDASERFIGILRQFRDHLSAAVVHCFTGERKALFAYLDLDLHIGITGWVCDERRGTHLHPLLREIPADRLMLETDAPYLLPRTLKPRPRHNRNEPAYLVEVLREVARHRPESEQELACLTSETARRFFNLTDPGDSRNTAVG